MKHVSHPVVLTQSYNPDGLIYSESFSVGLIPVAANKRLRIRNILVQGFYFKTTRGIDTPVSLAFLGMDRSPAQDILAQHDAGITVMADPETGAFTQYTGANPQIADISPHPLKPYRPHRFAYYNAPAAQYADASAEALTKKANLLTCLLVQGSSYGADFEVDMSSKKYIVLIPYLAGIKEAEIACSLRINFDFEEL